MEKRHLHLPEAMIHHIQSFLSGKEAAGTSILSKPWYTAWLTRPNLVFAESDFPIPTLQSQSKSAFVKFAKKSMQRHHDLNLNIQSFRLQICWSSFHASYNISLTNELIAEAMKLGATDLDIELTGKGRWRVSDFVLDFVLPREVLESETLARLSLFGAKIDLQDCKVNCLKLKSLSLSRVCIEDNDLWYIISICPLIENLVLSGCHHCTGVLTMKSGLCGVHKLRVLWLEKVMIEECFFGDISRFTCLKELTFKNCLFHNAFGKEIQICSNSLECISFTRMTMSMFKAKFDLPRICKFKFSGYCIPSLTFKATPKEWKSDISIKGAYDFQNSWFQELKKCLQDLRLSKIDLTLNIYLLPIPNTILSSWKKGYDYSVDIIPRVEKLALLMIGPSSIHSIVLENLLWICRPSLITLYWLPSFRFPHLDRMRQEESNNFTKFVCNVMSDHENGNMCGHGLEGVNVEFFEDDVAGLRPLPWKTLLEALTNLGKITMEVCLQLKWG